MIGSSHQSLTAAMAAIYGIPWVVSVRDPVCGVCVRDPVCVVCVRDPVCVVCVRDSVCVVCGQDDKHAAASAAWNRF